MLILLVLPSIQSKSEHFRKHKKCERPFEFEKFAGTFFPESRWAGHTDHLYPKIQRQFHSQLFSKLFKMLTKYLLLYSLSFGLMFPKFVK